MYLSVFTGSLRKSYILGRQTVDPVASPELYTPQRALNRNIQIGIYKESNSVDGRQ